MGYGLDEKQRQFVTYDSRCRFMTVTGIECRFGEACLKGVECGEIARVLLLCAGGRGYCVARER